MSKLPRLKSPMNFYHVTCRGNDRKFIFSTDDDKKFYLSSIWKNVTALKLQLSAYCIMNNHVHLLIGCELEQLSVFMQALNDSYGRYYNIKYNHVGHVFEKRYFSSPITSEKYFIECIRYIHQNPVKAQICSVDRYPWSSYQNYLHHRGPVAWEKGSVIIGDSEAYIHFMEQTPSDRYSFYDREDLYYSDEEARNYMVAYMQNHMSVDSNILLQGNKSTARMELIRYFHDHFISVNQIANFFSLSPWTIRKILRSSS